MSAFTGDIPGALSGRLRALFDYLADGEEHTAAAILEHAFKKRAASQAYVSVHIYNLRQRLKGTPYTITIRSEERQKNRPGRTVSWYRMTRTEPS